MRPAVDRGALEAARARAEAALFGTTEQPRLGRFVLLKPIGTGGMGTIHRAYDPHLERTVALKLVRQMTDDVTSGLRARLLAEARVLARLAHPNVVPVYEVVEIDHEVVVVMELVQGKNLAEWEHEHPRSWRELVEVYVQAGRGLAAAHELGIVHRDFKPANAVVGDDGRVRVLDFGLARLNATTSANEADGERAGATSRPLALCMPRPLTETGDILGTVAFMAPEQLAGGPTTAAADQFSFCVSLFRALYGAPPFAGSDPATLRKNILSARLGVASDARTPQWLRTVVCRGLAAAPQDRYPSMGALLDELSRERGWRRWRPAALAASVSVIALGVATLRPAQDAMVVCDGGGEEIAQVWNPARWQRIRDALTRVATPYAKDIDTRIQLALDAYRDRWSDIHVSACLEYQRAPADARLAAQLARKQQCLGHRLQDLAAAIEVLGELDDTSVTKAVDVAAGLPAVELCSNLETIPEEPGPPLLFATRMQVEAIRAQLRRANALERAGRSADALTLAEGASALARTLDYPAALLEAELARGTFLARRYDLDHAVAPLAKAEEIASEQRLYQAAVVAGARRIYVEGLRGENLDRLAGQVDELERLSRGLRVDHFARPLLLNYAGVLYMARGERGRASDYFRRAFEAVGDLASHDAELTGIEMNVAMLSQSRSERETLARRAAARYVSLLGTNHITTLSEQCRSAQYFADPMIALTLAREATERFRTFHPDQIHDRILCLSYQAFLTTEIGDPATAASLYEEVTSLAARSTDRDLLLRGRLASGHVHLLRKDPREALRHYKHVIQSYANSLNWWDDILVAEAQLGAGLAAEEVREPSAAVDHLQIAIRTLGALTERGEDVSAHQRLALARMALARNLRRVRRKATDARPADLEAQAKAFYREANPVAYRSRLDALIR